ncbi:MAG: hypothetical protein EAZ14_13065 [Runella slithyformis]|nr:MAG: hypothetical protein EAZ14_13065 [Runella slithyformis]
MDTITFVRVLVAGGVITPDELQRLAVVAQQHAHGGGATTRARQH